MSGGILVIVESLAGGGVVKRCMSGSRIIIAVGVPSRFRSVICRFVHNRCSGVLSGRLRGGLMGGGEMVGFGTCGGVNSCGGIFVRFVETSCGVNAGRTRCVGARGLRRYSVPPLLGRRILRFGGGVGRGMMR